jgi:predicted esterase
LEIRGLGLPSGKPARRGSLLVALATLLAAPAVSRSPSLKLSEVATAAALKPGITILDGVGLAYLPDHVSGPAPLLLLFHGAGMKASSFLTGMRAEADRCGCAMLAVQSSNVTWDLILSLGEAQKKARGRDLPDIEFGPDVDRVEQGLSQMLARAPIGRRKIIPVGFSDGASYALSLALANPMQFRSAVAIAPGFVMPAARLDRTQRLFIAHGKRDPVLPFDAARSAVVDPLQQSGFDVRFKPFEGGHYIDRPSLREGIDYALGAQG